jgi:membrane associated rhomboid family serine protease
MIVDEIKKSFSSGTMLTKIIYVNIGLFLLLNIIGVFFFLFATPFDIDSLTRAVFGVPSNLSKLLIKPWTLITYMFTHTGFLHMLFNVLWLYWFGRVFLSFFGEKKMLSLYLLGGLIGAVFYVASYNIFPVFSEAVFLSTCIGASASLMAIALAIAVYQPNYTFHLLFLGPVKIKYIAMFFVFTDILMIGDSNSGGHMAHLGGAFMGYLFAYQYKNKGVDLTRRMTRFLDAFVTFFKPRPKMKVSYKNPRQMSDTEYNYTKKVKQEEIDKILDKIAKNGYNSLSSEEKKKLFDMK